MFRSIGPMELIIILAVVLIIFGVGKLPEIGGAMGKAMRGFRKEMTGDKETKTSANKEESKEK